MTIDFVKPLENEQAPLDPTKIVRHKLTPRKLELSLVSVSRGREIHLHLECDEKDDMGINREFSCGLGNFDSPEEARYEYKRLLSALRDGDYQLHLYEDGEMKVELTQ